MQGMLRWALQVMAFLLITPSVWGVTYTLELEGGGTSNSTLLPGNIVNLAFTSPELNSNIWGSVEISYDPTVLQALYVDEPFDSYGFWTWWMDVAGDPTHCGGGMPYSYFTGGGSSRADQWAASFGEGTGPSAYIDQPAGKIRFYHNNYLVAGNHAPLRIGFRLVTTGATTVTVRSKDGTSYDWCSLNTVMSTNFTLGVP